jgi:glycosyltransferase involved in cell wall biosynthesis
LFLGSLASPRMVSMLNEAARMLSDLGRIHLVGLNKAHMYGGGEDCALDPLIKDHGELPEDAIWDYIRYAAIGLAFATGPHAFDNDVSKILNYLRGGLPVLSEEPIVNNDLIKQTGFGKIFRFGDITDMAAKARELIMDPHQRDREAVMQFMVQEHSWDKRVEVYLKLFQAILYG